MFLTLKVFTALLSVFYFHYLKMKNYSVKKISSPILRLPFEERNKNKNRNNETLQPFPAFPQGKFLSS